MATGDAYFKNLDGEFHAEFGAVQFIRSDDYNDLINHPSINGEELVGNKTFEQLGEETLTNSELKDIIDSQFDLIFGGNP